MVSSGFYARYPSPEGLMPCAEATLLYYAEVHVSSGSGSLLGPCGMLRGAVAEGPPNLEMASLVLPNALLAPELQLDLEPAALHRLPARLTAAR